jgi:predicted secreted protein
MMKKKPLCSKRTPHFISTSDSVINLRDKTDTVMIDDRSVRDFTTSCVDLVNKGGGRNLITLAAMILSLLMPFFFCISHAYGIETVTVNKEFNGREIKVRAGGMIRVELKELGAAGYAWAIKDLDKEHFDILSVKTKDVPSRGDIVGAPVIKTWLISTKKKGKAELRFLYYRPWEGEKNTADTFVLKVRIL